MYQELLFFCRTFLAGVFLAVCYDVLRIIRKIIVHTSFWMGMEDIFYWCFTGVFLFFVIYTENNGVIRSYALLAIGAGALVYRAGPGKVLLNLAVRLMEKILTPIRKWRKRLKFQWNRVKLFVGKQKIVRDIRECRNEEKKKRNLQNRIAMLSITL